MNCEDTIVSRSSRPRSSSGGWRLTTKYRGYSGKQANLTSIIGNSTFRPQWLIEIVPERVFSAVSDAVER
eukprot:2454643-Pleurochrysis_carterae.AAC.1